MYASTEAGTLFAAKGDSFQIPAAIRDKFLIQEEELLIHKSLLGQSDSFKFDGDYYHSGDLIEWVNEANGLFRFRSRKMNSSMWAAIRLTLAKLKSNP